MGRIWLTVKEIWEYVVVKNIVSILFQICHHIGLSKWAYRLAVNNILRERKFLMIFLEYGNWSDEEKKDKEKELEVCNCLLEKAYKIKQTML